MEGDSGKGRGGKIIGVESFLNKPVEFSRFNPKIQSVQYPVVSSIVDLIVASIITPIVEQIVSTSVSVSERRGKLNLAQVNCRGVVSKLASIKNMVVDHDLDVLVLTETLLQDEKRPRIPGYFSFNRNRVGRLGGGVAMLINDRFKKHVVKEDEGEGDCEFIAATFTCFEPRVSVTVYYGQQENTAGHEKVCSHLAAVLGSAEKLHLDGNVVYLVGDFNVHLGDKVFPNTNKKVSSGGQSLLTLIKETDLQIINRLNVSGGSGHTHFDRTAGTSNVLDLILTNNTELLDWLAVDEKFGRSPYRWKWGTGGKERIFSDHCAIYWRVATQTKPDSGKGPAPKASRWRYGKPGGHDRYKFELEAAFGEVMDTVVGEPDINVAVDNLYKIIDAAKSKAYGKTTVTAKKLKRVEEEKEWRRRVMEIDAFVEDIEVKYYKPMTGVWAARKGILMEGRYAEESAVLNYWTGETLREREKRFLISRWSSTKKCYLNKTQMACGKKFVKQRSVRPEWRWQWRTMSLASPYPLKTSTRPLKRWRWLTKTCIKISTELAQASSMLCNSLCREYT